MAEQVVETACAAMFGSIGIAAGVEAGGGRRKARRSKGSMGQGFVGAGFVGWQRVEMTHGWAVAVARLGAGFHGKVRTRARVQKDDGG